MDLREGTLGTLLVLVQRGEPNGYLLFGDAVPGDVVIDYETLSAQLAFAEIVVGDVSRFLGPQASEAGNLNAIVGISEHQVRMR